MPRQVRKIAGKFIRRWGLLPGGVPDGLGEDDQLAQRVLEGRVAVFFPDPPENLYQLRQWYAAFEALDAELGLTVILQDSRTAALVRAECALDVVIAARTRTVGTLLGDGAVRLVLYVGQANANAVALRVTQVLHVFLNHGDSDKYVSVSNQVKAFDRAFVAGPAGVDRHARALLYFDTHKRLRIVGRPQLPPHGTPGPGLTVLYAPTWEGTMSVNAYSSVVDFGYELVDALLADEDISVIYRPHPRTGASDAYFQGADQRIRALVARYGDRARTDDSVDPEASFHAAHVLIADVSAIATDWLSQRRPLITTLPAASEARVAAPARLFDDTPHIDAATAPEAARIVRESLADNSVEATMDRLSTYYLGGLTGPQAQATFVDACREAVADCEKERARLGVEA